MLLPLAVECLLWLSERIGWPGWHKGYAVLTAVASVGLAMLLMILWFIVSLMFRRRFQFSLRSLLVLVVVVALPCNWLAVEMKKARRQKEVDGIRKSEGQVSYDSGPILPKGLVEPNGPVWLRKLFGDDFFNDSIQAFVFSNTEMESLRGLP